MYLLILDANKTFHQNEIGKEIRDEKLKIDKTST